MRLRRIIVLIWLGIGSALGCSEPNEPLPEEMIGVWRSDAAIYADRYLELQPGFVTFGTGKYTMDLRSIERVRSEPATPRGRAYTLSYRNNEGELLDMSFVFHPGPPAHLRLSHRKERWTRETSSTDVPKRRAK